jgi:hypothetical protein
MDKVKHAVKNCDALKPLNYDWDSDIVMAVNAVHNMISIRILSYHIISISY